MRVLSIFLLCVCIFADPYFPDDNWETKNYDEVGLDESKIDNLFELTFSDDATMSAVLIKDGYIIREQYAEGFNKDSFGILRTLSCTQWKCKSNNPGINV